MFRFWTSESKGCAKPAETLHTAQQPTFAHDNNNSMPAAIAASVTGSSAPTLKRKSRSDDNSSTLPLSPTAEFDPPCDNKAPSSNHKRMRSATELEAPWPQSAFAAKYSENSGNERCASPPTPPLSVALALDGPSLDAVADIVQYQFSHEILLKHNELRLIDQEMARCQIAMEQLRRCHLIPYPTTCPTYEQMLDISSGRGPPVRTRPGATVPKWSAPYGVTDGPYARHYTKWLIPDPMFDGTPSTLMVPTSASQQSRSRSGVFADSRSTRNSSSVAPVADTSKGRPTRTSAGQKLQALANVYPPARPRAGPCVLKRSDGQVVKLVCVDCNRDNFSSTQGFINHCRIAHKREYKSHDEAAVHCGQPLDSDDPVPPPVAAPPKKRSVVAAPARPSVVSSIPAHAAAPAPAALGCVHPLARIDSTATDALLERMESSNEVYCQAARGAAQPTRRQSSTPASASFASSMDAPFLSKFLEEKQFSGDVDASVSDAKAPSGLENVDWSAVAAKEAASSRDKATTAARSKPGKASKASKTLVTPASAKRAPAGSRLVQSAVSPTSATGFEGTAENAASPEGMSEDEMEVDLSPLPSAAYNAPSLVSDDGESEDESSDAEADPADVDMDLGDSSDVSDYNSDENDDEPARPLSHHRGGVKLRRDGSKHATFVSPVKGSNKGKHN